MSWWQWAIGIYAVAAILLGAGTTFGVAGLSVTGPPPAIDNRPQVEITAFDWVFVGLSGAFFVNWTDLNVQMPATVSVLIIGAVGPSVTYGATGMCPPTGPTPCSAKVPYVFPGFGTYTVRANVTVKDITGKVLVSAQTNQHVITVSSTSGTSGGTGSSAVVARFTFVQVLGTLNVQFTDNSVAVAATVNSATIAWQFGDGSTGTGPSPSHQYTTSGRFSVTEQVSATTSQGATITNSTVHSVKVVPVGCTTGTCTPNLKIGFSWNITGLTVVFTDTSTVAKGAMIQTRVWNFGDGNTASGTPVTHTFSSAGTYRVNETVTANFSTTVTTKTITQSITISSLSTSGSGCTDITCNGGSVAPFFNLNWYDGALLGSGILGLVAIATRLRQYPLIPVAMTVVGGIGGFVVGTIW